METLQNILSDTIEALIPVFITVLTIGTAWVGRTFNLWLAAKTTNVQLQTMFTRLTEVVSTVVLELQQTEVEAIKEALKEDSPGGRKITKDEAKELLDKALTKVKSYLGDDGLKIVAYILGITKDQALNEFLISRIEATVNHLKKVEKK